MRISSRGIVVLWIGLAASVAVMGVPVLVFLRTPLGEIPVPAGIALWPFWFTLVILLTLGEMVGYGRREGSWGFLLLLGLLLAASGHSLFSSSFWHDVWTAPASAVLWWAIGITVGLAIGYLARRRVLRT